MNPLLLKAFVLSFILLSITTITTAQTTEEEKEFMRTFVKAQASTTMPADEENVIMQLEKVPFYLHLNNEDHVRTVSFSMVAHEDLNDNGIKDYIILCNAKGIQEGQEYTQGVLSILSMKNKTEYYRRRNITTEQPCLWYKINNIKYSNKKLTATITRAICPHMAPVENPESTTLTFAFEGERCYEEGYRTKCKMSEMKDKTIFKKNLPGKLKQEIETSSQTYVDASNEKYEEDNIEVNAALNGCDNLQLSFLFKITNNSGETLTDDASKAKILESIDFLIDRTRYKTVLKKIKDDYEKQPYSSNSSRRGTFDNHWKYEVSQLENENDGETLMLGISIYNEENLYENNMWDIIMKRK